MPLCLWKGSVQGRKLVLLLAAALLGPSHAWAQARTLIKDVRVFDGVRVEQRRSVLIDSGRIVRIDDARFSDGTAVVIDGRGFGNDSAERNIAHSHSVAGAESGIVRPANQSERCGLSWSCEQSSTHAFETMFHEVQHAMDDSLVTAVNKAFRDARKPSPRDPTHPFAFFTTGDVTRGIFPGHTPYGEQFGLWRVEEFAHLRPLLIQEWAPYIVGKVTLDDACTGLR